MRALLVNTPTYGTHLRSVPLGLLYIASSCGALGREVALLDGSLFDNPSSFDAALLRHDFDVIGLSAMTHNFPEALRIGSLVRHHRPAARIVFGGAHASTIPSGVARALPCDLVLAGEGERSFPALLDALDTGASLADVPGLHWHENGALRHNPPLPVADLDSLPFPAYDLVDFSRYTIGAHGLYFKRKPLTPLVTSRGCPFHCSFCAKTALTGDTWRPRSPENVLDEISLLVNDYGIREIHFEDDNIALKEDRFVAICKGLIDRRLDVTWKCPHGIYAAHLSDETFSLMARSGCYSLSFGIESGNDSILEKAGKVSTTAQVARAVRSAKAAGIQCIGFFIFGLEGETPATIHETIRFAKSLPLDAAQFNLCVPFIGTPIRETYIRLGYTSGEDIESYDVDHAVLNLPGLSARDLKRARLRAFLSFYSRPSVLFTNIRNLSSTDVLKALFYRLRNICRA